jgi:hypothetical protein
MSLIFGTLAWLQPEPAFRGDTSFVVSGSPWRILLRISNHEVDFHVRMVAESKFRSRRRWTSCCCQASDQDHSSSHWIHPFVELRAVELLAKTTGFSEQDFRYLLAFQSSLKPIPKMAPENLVL